MDRPSRNKKAINYSDFLDDDDEDFATAPPNKKARGVQECQPDKTRKNQLVDLTTKARKERVSLDEKLYKRDLETALIMSQLESTEKLGEPISSRLDEKLEPQEDVPPVLTHFSVDGSCFDGNKPPSEPSEDAPPVLSNCSVDVTSFGLDQISSEQTPSSLCTKRKSQKVTEKQSEQNEEDEDYRPQNTPESESEFSDLEESEDEEYTVKRKQDKRKMSKKEKKTSPKAVKKEKKPAKPAKTKPQSRVKNSALSSPGVRSPSAAQPLSALNRSPSTPPVNKSALHSSPAGGRMPKWTPPGLIGRSSSSCQSPPLKSPGLGLRLGLSRLARVKPLHPNSVAH
ncbi:hypothetical protein KOW79_016034 [Hemibagrus wyckioides]|uniref:RAD51 interacting motif domain-containing protein n=1 Tax=Hemibagrus wyckioides TaxID=337641 RepID=A0A9D3SDA3_9TELE|nr:RAD51-associated protein 1 isoform X1 [Hemibagrus wyckioides]KAG7320181.1 hypothetical protein KOW79_016034 [Hemibagrus wyckioides]